MHFLHSQQIWQGFPELAAGAFHVEGLTPNVSVAPRVAAYYEIAAGRLQSHSEGDLPEIQAWRRAFSKMGLKPTQYRCASEALLRRFKKEGALPSIHPLIDLCNAVSLAFAIPVAALDVTRIHDGLEVTPADGSESYLSFAGENETPEPGEVTFRDGANRAHARRWTYRQSAYSAIRDTTEAALIVIEGLHATAQADVERAIATLGDDIRQIWRVEPRFAMLSHGAPRFEF